MPSESVVKSEFSFRDVVLSNVKTANSKKGNLLVFVSFVGLRSYQASPQLLYFGDADIQSLEQLKGSKVEVVLSGGGQSFTVENIIPQ